MLILFMDLILIMPTVTKCMQVRVYYIVCAYDMSLKITIMPPNDMIYILYILYAYSPLLVIIFR